MGLNEIDDNVVRLKLQRACGSCPSVAITMKLGKKNNKLILSHK